MLTSLLSPLLRPLRLCGSLKKSRLQQRTVENTKMNTRFTEMRKQSSFLKKQSACLLPKYIKINVRCTEMRKQSSFLKKQLSILLGENT